MPLQRLPHLPGSSTACRGCHGSFLRAAGRALGELAQARQRWAAYVDRKADLDLLDGDALLHTDFNPLNILLGPDRTWIIDWAWPTGGAAFIDAACFLIRAMAADHNASPAEVLAAQCPGWSQASPAAIDVFALASAGSTRRSPATTRSPSSSA